MAELSEADDLLATELAFGLLDAPELELAQQRLASDPAFAAAHRRWQDRAANLFAGADVAPPASVWNAIRARLPANDAAPRSNPAGRLRWWQAGAAAAAVVAAFSTAALLTRPLPVSPAPAPVTRATPRPLVALLSSPQRTGAVAIGFDPVARRLTALSSRVAPGARATELWIIPAGGVPHAVGVIAADKPDAQPIPAAVAALIVPGATLAISLEPRGGSPTGAPTGPVILTGSVAAA